MAFDLNRVVECGLTASQILTQALGEQWKTMEHCELIEVRTNGYPSENGRLDTMEVDIRGSLVDIVPGSELCHKVQQGKFSQDLDGTFELTKTLVILSKGPADPWAPATLADAAHEDLRTLDLTDDEKEAARSFLVRAEPPDSMAATGNNLDLIGAQMGYVRHEGESDADFKCRVREGMESVASFHPDSPRERQV